MNALQEELAAFTIGGLVWGNDPNTPIPGLTPGQKFDGNASGTANFAGGWTRMNEEGGELAYLPQGTAIVPADKTNRILDSGSGDNSVNATVNITIEGSADQNTVSRIRDELTAFFDAMWRKKQSQQTNTRALWQAAV
ncbi:hypothetical protein AGMMS49992_22620 [Clostridia bacterium]|nr:hypothetical protein AGMMS49992_22620 [Clostridia bacterium]